MNQEELKQRLIELLIDADCAAQEAEITDYQEAMAHMTDYLVGNDVTIRERGEWKDNHCTVCGMTPICEETWTSHDITPPKFEWCMDFCPHCGADMRGVTDTNVGDKSSWVFASLDEIIDCYGKYPETEKGGAE